MKNSNPDRERERPTPPVEPAPPAGAEQGRGRSAGPGGRLVLGLGAVLLLGVLLVLFWPHPQELSEPPEPPVSGPVSGAPVVTPAPSAGQEDAVGKDPETERLLQSWLAGQAAAEAEDVSSWGGETYRAAVASAAECERLAGERQWAGARKQCRAATARLDALLNDKPQLLAAALDRGTRALEGGDAETADKAFRRALTLDPENAAARDGLQRARQLPEVLKLTAVARRQETAGSLREARDAYTAALALDARFVPAREGLSRVEAALVEEQFQQLVSRALKALAEDRFAAAGKALARAERLKPHDATVTDLRRQLTQARLGARLQQLRREAAAHEEKEEWEAALKTCDRALQLDPAAAFATACRERTGRRVELDRQLTQTLAVPDRLFEEGPLATARRLLDRASRITPAGPRLKTQLAGLKKLIREAEAEVEVLFSSDGKTEVVIYHVGRLGRFQRQRLVLRTGDYTVVGSRDGYRDVRRVLKVRPGSGPIHFTLRCEEPI